MITNVPIQRRTFALHVLNGVVPVHDSRIEALARIYRNRYAYALRTLAQDESARSIIAPAAADILRLLGSQRGGRRWGSSFNGIAEEDIKQMHVTGMYIDMQFTLRFGKGDRPENQGFASLRLDRDGWSLNRLQRGSHDFA